MKWDVEKMFLVIWWRGGNEMRSVFLVIWWRGGNEMRSGDKTVNESRRRRGEWEMARE